MRQPLLHLQLLSLSSEALDYELEKCVKGFPRNTFLCSSRLLLRAGLLWLRRGRSRVWVLLPGLQGSSCVVFLGHWLQGSRSTGLKLNCAEKVQLRPLLPIAVSRSRYRVAG